MPAVRDKDTVTGNGHVNQGQPGGLKHVRIWAIGKSLGECIDASKTP
jgi:hypothetical protein